MKLIRIIIIEDHRLIREMWKELFSKKDNLSVVAESGSFMEGIDLIKTNMPEIVLLDINLSSNSGFDAVPLIRKYSPNSRVIVVSVHNQPAYVKKMFQLGAKGYVTKNSTSNEILEAIDKVMKGEKYICSEINDILFNQIQQDAIAETDLKDLSLREIEIIRLIKEGFSSKEMGERLFISTRTVEVHRHNILRKLNLKNSTELVRYIQHRDV